MVGSSKPCTQPGHISITNDFPKSSSQQNGSQVSSQCHAHPEASSNLHQRSLRNCSSACAHLLNGHPDGAALCDIANAAHWVQRGCMEAHHTCTGVGTTEATVLPVLAADPCSCADLVDRITG